MIFFSFLADKRDVQAWKYLFISSIPISLVWTTNQVELNICMILEFAKKCLIACLCSKNENSERDTCRKIIFMKDYAL